jgi:hypothetical protein
MKTSLFALIGLALLVIAGCGGTGDSVPPVVTPEVDYTRVTDSTFAFGSTVPAPTGEVVLRVTGLIGAGNAADGAIEFDIETLESLGLVEFMRSDIVRGNDTRLFKGVLLADVLAAVGVQDGATSLAMRAFDDYLVDIPISDTETYNVLIATHQNGERLTLDTFGPLRIVYPPSAPDLIDERWIWTLIAMNVQ